MKTSFRRERQGTTLIETMAAMVILALALCGLYALSGQTSNLVRKSEGAADAQRNCIARMDQLHSMGWASVSDPSKIATLLGTKTGSITFDQEVISVYEVAVPQTSPLPSPTPSPTPVPSASPLFTVTRSSSGSVTISPSGFDSATSLAKLQLNYRVLTQWVRTGTTEKRELSTIISSYGSR